MLACTNYVAHQGSKAIEIEHEAMEIVHEVRILDYSSIPPHAIEPTMIR